MVWGEMEMLVTGLTSVQMIFTTTNNNWMGDWGVWRDGGDFYLTYSVAPEPSTYIMISALFLVIGVNQSSRKTFRSIIASVRKKFSKKSKAIEFLQN